MQGLELPNESDALILLLLFCNPTAPARILAPFRGLRAPRAWPLPQTPIRWRRSCSNRGIAEFSVCEICRLTSECAVTTAAFEGCVCG